MLALAVLLGSIPIKHAVARLVSRQVSEVRGGWLGLASLLEAAIGFAVVYLAKGSLESDALVALAGALVLISSAFPYWLMFKPQGLNPAAALGTLAAINPPAGACILGAFLLAVMLPDRRWAPMIAAITVPIWLRVFGSPIAYIWYGLALCGCVLMIGFLRIANDDDAIGREGQ